MVKTNKTTVINIKKDFTWDVYIGRPSIWENPFVIGRDGTWKQVLKQYKEHILNTPVLIDKLKKLKGLRLGCYCKPKACHGDVLVELIEKIYPDTKEFDSIL